MNTQITQSPIETDLARFRDTLLELRDFPNSASLQVRLANLKDALRSYGFTPQEIADLHRKHR